LIRTTCAPGIAAIDTSSTSTSVAPTAGGRITRPCSIRSTLRSWTNAWRPVIFAGTSGRGSGLPTTR
jgi:hypothetical protein